MKKVKLTKEEARLVLDVLSEKLVVFEMCFQRGIDENKDVGVLAGLMNKRDVVIRVITKLY